MPDEAISPLIFSIIFWRRRYISSLHSLEQTTGEVTEWLKVHAWKACVRQRTAGSNPALSASRSKFDSRVLHNKGSRIPPGPEGSNGSDYLCVLQGARLSFF